MFRDIYVNFKFEIILVFLAMAVFAIYSGTLYKKLLKSVPVAVLLIASLFFRDVEAKSGLNIMRALIVGAILLIYSWHFSEKKVKRSSDYIKVIVVAYPILVLIATSIIPLFRLLFFLYTLDLVVFILMIILTISLWIERRSEQTRSEILDDFEK